MVCTCEKGSSRGGQNPLLLSHYGTYFSCQNVTKKDSLSVCLGLSLFTRKSSHWLCSVH